MPRVTIRDGAKNEVERVRRKIGLSRTQFMRELSNILPGRDFHILHIYNTPDEDLPPALLDVVHSIEEQFDEFVQTMLECLDTFPPDRILSITEVAEITSISEYNISRLRDRGRIKATQIATNKFGYTPNAVRDLVRFASDALNHPAYMRGPLANPFLSHYYLTSKVIV